MVKSTNKKREKRSKPSTTKATPGTKAKAAAASLPHATETGRSETVPVQRPLSFGSSVSDEVLEARLFGFGGAVAELADDDANMEPSVAAEHQTSDEPSLFIVDTAGEPDEMPASTGEPNNVPAFTGGQPDRPVQRAVVAESGEDAVETAVSFSAADLARRSAFNSTVALQDDSWTNTTVTDSPSLTTGRSTAPLTVAKGGPVVRFVSQWRRAPGSPVLLTLGAAPTVGRIFHPHTPSLSFSYTPNGSNLFANPLAKSAAAGKLTSFSFDNEPPTRAAAFVADGSKVLLARRRRHTHLVDVESGNIVRQACPLGRWGDASRELMAVGTGVGSAELAAFAGASGGDVPITDALTGHLVGTAHTGGALVRSVAWLPGDPSSLAALSATSDIFIYDVRKTVRPVTRFRDEGALESTCLAVSPSGNIVAVGDRSGTINLYRRNELGRTAKPFATSSALRTAVTSISFSPDERTFVSASSQHVDALKVVSIEGSRCTTLPSWPTTKTPLSLVAHVDTSSEGHLSIATDRSSFLLYSITNA